MNGNQPPPLQTRPKPKTSALAIWSLILGILGLLCFSVVTAVPAVICGHMATSRIKRAGGAMAGNGLAIGGLVTGYLGLMLLPLMLAIAIPNFVKARHNAQRNACINNLRQIDGAKHGWALEQKKNSGDPVVAADLNPYLLPGNWTCPKGGVYQINPVDDAPTCSISGHELAK